MTRIPVRVRHRKRGSEYLVLGEGKVQISRALCSDDQGLYRKLREGDYLVVYRGEGGMLWLRAPEEFDDGRFEAAEARESPLRDELARILEQVAREGLTHPRHLDAALDAIGAALAVRADEVQAGWSNPEDQIGRPAVWAALRLVLKGMV